MAINRVMWGDETLIDLTGDTIEALYIIKKKTAHDRAGNKIEGTCPYDADTSEATATADEILEGEKAYCNGNEVIGTMPRRENVVGYIDNINTPYSIDLGYHDGAGKVYIAPGEAAKLQPEVIKEGFTILGVKGTMTGLEGLETEDGEATPSVKEQTVVPSAGKYFTSVVVHPIPYVETANTFGTTVKIG